MNTINEKVDKWIRETIELHPGGIPPHGTNLLHQLNKKTATNKEWQKAFETIMPAYSDFHRAKIDERDPSGKYNQIVGSLNKYMEALKKTECRIFKHQADFYSSVIPEVFHKLFSEILIEMESEFIVSSQKDIVVDCIFDVFEGGRLIFKKKRVDVAIVLPCNLELNGQKHEFAIPVIAMEVKTNIDKNMLSGIEQSVESLKRTFPACLYYAVSELADFSVEKQNYATTNIDEIYILRRQKRSEVRKNLSSLKEVDTSLIEEIAQRTITHLTHFESPITTLKQRLNSGILINRGE